MPTEEYGKQFSELRDLYKEAERLGVIGIQAHEPCTRQEMQEALDAIVQNTRQLLFELDTLTRG
jgi:hypothetical protein